MGIENIPESEPTRALSLSGEWQLALDPDGQGIVDNWPGAGWPAQRANAVPVPALWDVTQPGYEGVGYYQRSFKLPAGWVDKVLLLCFDGVAYRAEVWVNGQYAGSHEGAYTSFFFDITRLASPEIDNVLVVRVAGLSREWPVDGQVLEQAPVSKQNWYYSHGGIWGDVRLEAREWIAVQTLQVEPDLQRESAQVEVTLHNRRPEARQVDLRLRILRPDGELAAAFGGLAAVPPGVVRLTYCVSLSQPWPWHYERPLLYRLQAAAQDGPDVDQLSTSFGMRDFTVQNGQFILNGQPIYVRGILLQPHYPVGLVVPPDREMLRREIVMMKDAGFNLIRVHIRPAAPGFLELADELGMLIYAESSLAWIRDSPRMLDHCRREVQAMIERDFNHASVVIWGIFNENPPASALWSEPLLRHARALDSTRVVVDNSGGALAIDQDFGWIDRAHVLGSRETTRQKILDIHLYLGASVPGPVYEWMRTVGGGSSSQALAEEDFGSTHVFAEFDREARDYRGKVFVSELGCGGMTDLDETLAGYGDNTALRDAAEFAAFRDSLHEGFYARGLEAIFESPRGLVLASQALQAAGNTSQVEALLCNPRVSGYCLTQLNDLSWEFHAGLLDVWRNPKPAYHAIRRLNQPHVLVLRAEGLGMHIGQPLGAALTLVNHQPLPAGAELSVVACSPAGQEQVLLRRPAPLAAGIYPLGTLAITAGEAGSHQVRARLMAGSTLVAEAVETALCLPSVDWTTVPGSIRWFGQAPVLAQSLRAEASGNSADLVAAAAPGSLLEDDWDTLLDVVLAGQTGVIGPVHTRDTLALRRLARRGLDLRLHFGIGSWMGCYHWQPQSPLFDGLPAGGLAAAAYGDVLPWYAMSENGGQVLAGSLRNTQTFKEASAMLWYSDVEVVPLGAGRLIMCQYRIFDSALHNPLAGRMLANLLRLAGGL